MTSPALNVFSPSESANLKSLLKNPDDDFQEIVSLLKRKVIESKKQLLELDEKYHSLIDGLTHVGIGIDIVSKDYKILFQNQVLKERFGDCREKNCYSSYMSLENPCEFCPMEEALKYNRVERIELKAADGRFYELISAPYPNRDGTIDKVAEVVIDITERKKAEVKLRESENKYKNLSNELETIIDIIPGMLFVKDKNDIVTHVNQNFADSLNLEKEQIIGKTSFDLFPIEQAEDFRKDDLEVITSGEPKLNIEESADFPGGKVWAITNKAPYYNEKGDTMGIIGLSIDITERKQTRQKLKESEEKYRGLINNITDIIFELGINGKCTYVSNQLFEISGFHPEEMIGQNVFQYLHPEDFLNVTEKVKEAFQKGIRISIDFRIRHKDGFYVPVSSNFNVIRINGEQRFIGVLRDNTEKRKAEQELLKEKEFTETALNTQRDTFFVFEPSTGKAVRWNKAFSEISGYSDIEIANLKAPESYYSKKDLENISKVDKLIEKGGTALNELTLITKEGNLVPFEYAASGIFNEYKKLKYIVAIGRDIRERKETEKKLKETEKFLSNIFTSIQDGICVLDEDFNIISANPKIEEWYTHSKPLIGKKCFQAFRNQLESCEDCDCKKILTSGDPFCESEIYKEINGKIDQIFDVYSFPLYDKETGNIDGIIKYMRDITIQKKAEQKLKESEENFRNIAEQSFMGIEIIQDGKIKYVNDAASKILEYSIQEMKAWEYEDLFKFVYPEDLPIIYEQQKKRQEEKLPHIRYSIRAITKSGKIKWLEISSKMVLYQGKEAIFAIFYDISERIEAEQELIKLNQMKSELLRRTSHELKTPLVSIKGFSELLLEVHRDKLDALVISTLNEIKHGCLRLETLIGDILKTAELESGTIQLHKSEEDLSFLVRLCVNDIKGFLKLRDHTIKVELQEKLITQFEKEQIHQVIGNLLNNAIKYTPPSGIIEIKSDIKDEFIIIAIKDNGIGFTEEEKTRIFKQFGKIERYGQGMDIIAEGSGFGLFISKKIIELHGGDIWVESEGRNMGSTFYFSLPLI